MDQKQHMYQLGKSQLPNGCDCIFPVSPRWMIQLFFMILICQMVVWFVFLESSFAARTMQILSIDVNVSQNPIPCGGSATVTATITYSPYGNLPANLGATISLWDYDTFLRDGDDELDRDWEIFFGSSGEVTAEFTIHCQTKEGGCGLYGPRGNSGESGTDIFVKVEGTGEKSSRVYVNCYQPEVDATIGLESDDTVTVGDDIIVHQFGFDPIENLTNATWHIQYNSVDLSVKHIEFVNPELVMFATYAIGPGMITFSVTDAFPPLLLFGPLVDITFTASSTPSTLWDATLVEGLETSTFYNHLGDEIDVCMGGSHAIFIAPNDTTSPALEPSMVEFYQSRVTGAAGAATDDLSHLPNYLTAELYDENNDLVAASFVNSDGSFELDRFFILDTQLPSTLKIFNGMDLFCSHEFLPMPDPIVPLTGVLELLLLEGPP